MAPSDPGGCSSHSVSVTESISGDIPWCHPSSSMLATFWENMGLHELVLCLLCMWPEIVAWSFLRKTSAGSTCYGVQVRMEGAGVKEAVR